MKNKCEKNQNFGLRGFTLIELLVVIAIIALLLSILIPALGKVKDLARDIMCQSNFKQVGITMNAYAQANKQRIPGPAGTTFWMLVYAPYVGTNLTNLSDFSQYGKIPVFNCPKYPVKEQVVDYINNSWSSLLSGQDPPGGVEPIRRISDWKNPGTKAHMSDYETTDGTPNLATGGSTPTTTAAQLVWNATTLSANAAVLDVYQPAQLPYNSPGIWFDITTKKPIPSLTPGVLGREFVGYQQRRVAINRHKKFGADVLYLDGHAGWVFGMDNNPGLWVRK